MNFTYILPCSMNRIDLARNVLQKIIWTLKNTHKPMAFNDWLVMENVTSNILMINGLPRK